MMKVVVLACMLAAAAGNLIAPWSVPIAAPWALGAPLLMASNYRGPLSLAPGQPANIIAADGRPLDTLDVNLDRSAHLTARALTGSGVHLLKKRSIAPLITPLAPTVPLGIASPLGLTAPLALSAPLWTGSNYRGPLSLAPGQPANIIAADGRPLDTLDVNLDRSAHLTAKALSGSGVHLLKKRSIAPLIAPAVPLGIASPLGLTAPLALTAPLWTGLNYRGPLSLAPGQPANIIAADGRPLDTLAVNLDRSAHITANALSGSGVHLLKKRSAPLIAPLAVSRVAVASAPLVAPLGYATPTVLSSGIATAPLTYTRAPVVAW